MKKEGKGDFKFAFIKLMSHLLFYDTGGKRLLKLQEASFYGIPSGYDNKLEKATISPFFLDVENCLFVE